MAEAVSTRQRLIAEGMRLFAEKGFSATTVGAIEAAAGLQPRRGALYKHFASKDALLEAAVQDHLDRVRTGAQQIAQLDLSTAIAIDPESVRPLVVALGRWFLDELDRHRDFTHVLEHEGRRFADLAAVFRRDVIEAGYRAAAMLLTAVAPDVDDADEISALLLGGLVTLRRTAWTFGAPPLGVDDDRALATWTDLVLTVLAAATGTARRP
jgi:AcrR family transcriptional regulator